MHCEGEQPNDEPADDSQEEVAVGGEEVEDELAPEQ